VTAQTLILIADKTERDVLKLINRRSLSSLQEEEING